MNAYELADGMETLAQVNANIDEQIRGCMMDSATMLRQQADRIAELEKFNKAILKKGGCDGNICKRYDTHPHKELSDELFNKAFDFYCETDEGVLRFDFELREEWKQEQLKRWKEAFIKASRGEE